MTSQDRTGNDDDVTGAGAGAVRQLRLVVAADDFDEAVAFYRDVLGMPEEAAFQGEGDARVVILHAGRATLEIADPAQKRMIDDVEVGRQVAPALRVALEVDDATATTRALVAGGAEELAPPTVTPWRSLDSRLRAPAGLQVTVFEELDPPAGRTVRPYPDRRPASPLDRVPWPVRTERLSLRAATADDAAATWRFRRLEPVGRWITRAPTTFEEHRDAFRDPDRLATTVVVERDPAAAGGSSTRTTRSSASPSGRSAAPTCTSTTG